MALPDGGRSRARRWRWVRRAAVAGGLLTTAVAVISAVQYSRTPAILLQHAPPSPSSEHPLTPYEKAHLASASCSSIPVAARTGPWIEIPALDVALPIVAGDGSNNIPDCKALHYPGTASPGQPGASYLYAHGLWGMFGELLYARVGQAVLIHDYTAGTEQTLHISRLVGDVAWNDTSLIHMASRTPLLTLQTCVGADPHSDRWVVQAT